MAIAAAAVSVGLIALFGAADPPATPLILQERMRLGAAAQDWVPLEEIAPALRRAVLAAEDAGFCSHWGVDEASMRAAGAAFWAGEARPRGGSTITQQTAKNLLFGPARTLLRKSAELWAALWIEALWSKRRILEVYLNVAEFGPGVFGAEAAARAHFGVSAADLNWDQAARLAAVLPAPRVRDPNRLSPALETKRARTARGADDLAATGGAGCVGG